MSSDNIHYFFQELIKNIITLSSPAEKQIYIIGIGHTGDEMVIDFDTFYSGHKNHYLELGLLTLEQLRSLENFNEFLDEKCVNKSGEFFMSRSELKLNKTWDEIRCEAKKLLILLNKDQMDIEVKRDVKGNVEHTRTKLISKDRIP